LAPTPTPDRLAPPVLPANPNQAEKGSYAFWQYCLPCHGDRGQGLTEDFRQLYPPEDNYCWESGCHGQRPYPNGWTLPTSVPAVLGSDSLTRFDTAATLFAFVRNTMPFQAPGSLDEETYWEIVAFLVEGQGQSLGGESLGPANASAISLQP
jgi:cytochrome c